MQMFRTLQPKPFEHRFLPAAIVACLLIAGWPANGQSDSRQQLTVEPVNVQSHTGPSIHTIESSNLDADFSPGEATTNAPAELDEINAPHDSYLGFLGVDRPLDLLVNSLVGVG
jgi:hypothetical protein